MNLRSLTSDLDPANPSFFRRENATSFISLRQMTLLLCILFAVTYGLSLMGDKENTKRMCYPTSEMDEGRKRVLAIVAGIIVARHLQTADDLFGGPQGSPRTDKMIAASIQWADRILKKIDSVCSNA
jgi:hypothetical protein